ncbi:MAG: hypothetical protein E7422_04640 [Ruminococcaceae bacterium]|nr:hypothetical protein [Oscillospiraceae bacterium]
MKQNRLVELEKRAAALLNGVGLVTVSFDNGTMRKIRLADVIPLLVDGGELTVTDVTGDTGTGNGQLLELLRGLLEGEA